MKPISPGCRGGLNQTWKARWKDGGRVKRQAKGRGGELTCRPHCSCRRPGRGRICRRNPFCPICSRRTASSPIPAEQMAEWKSSQFTDSWNLNLFHLAVFHQLYMHISRIEAAVCGFFPLKFAFMSILSPSRFLASFWVHHFINTFILCIAIRLKSRDSETQKHKALKLKI